MDCTRSASRILGLTNENWRFSGEAKYARLRTYPPAPHARLRRTGCGRRMRFRSSPGWWWAYDIALPLRRVMMTRPAGVLPIAPLARRDRPEAHILQNCSLCKTEPMSKITQRLTPSQTQDGLTLMKQRLFNALDSRDYIKSQNLRQIPTKPQIFPLFFCTLLQILVIAHCNLNTIVLKYIPEIRQRSLTWLHLHCKFA